MTHLNLNQMTDLLLEQYIKRNISRYTVERTDGGEDVVTVVKNDNEFRYYHFHSKESVMEFIKGEDNLVVEQEVIEEEEFVAVEVVGGTEFTHNFEVGDRLVFIDKENAIENGFYKLNSESLDDYENSPIDDFDFSGDIHLENGYLITRNEFKHFKVKEEEVELTLEKVEPIAGDILKVVDWVGLERELRENDEIDRLYQWKEEFDKFVVDRIACNYNGNVIETGILDGYTKTEYSVHGGWNNIIHERYYKFFKIIGNESDNSPKFEPNDEFVCIDEDGFCSGTYYSDNRDILNRLGPIFKVEYERTGGRGGYYLFDSCGRNPVILKNELKYFRKRK